MRRTPLGTPLIKMGSVTSTMDVARRLIELGAPDGTTLLAASQTVGRGRGSRGWDSPPGTGLYCSVVLRPGIDATQFSSFSVAVGLAICDALDPSGQAGIQVKWPNDILLGGRKLCGILVTTSLSGSSVESAIVGFGINMIASSTLPANAAALDEITSLRGEEPSKTLNLILQEISRRYECILGDDALSAIGGWEKRLAFLNLPVTVEDNGHLRTGILRGVDSAGALLLETTGTTEAVRAGDLTRGPIISKFSG